MIRRVDDEADPAGMLRARGLRPSTWSAGAGTLFGRHSHAHCKHLFVLEGSISFDDLVLSASEGIVIEAGTEHGAVVGTDGVSCLEAFEE